MIPFGRALLPEVSGHMLICTCLTCTWREALICSVWIDFQVYMSGLGLIYLAILSGRDAHLVFGLETCRNNYNYNNNNNNSNINNYYYYVLGGRTWLALPPQGLRHGAQGPG
jgi:hypothetical protein